MSKTMSRIITVYVLCWITLLIVILLTQEEITLYYASISTFFIGIIGLMGLIAIKKAIALRSSSNNPEVIGLIISSVLFVALILFVVIFSLLY